MELLDKINWSQVIPGFLSGGALGALIKQFFDNRRNRIQPIGKSVEIKSVYDSSENKLLNSEISLTGTTQTGNAKKPGCRFSSGGV
ncbi:hypothetical protein ABIC45_004222 [Mucilaginibacter rubeus]|uniref:hypothetical protein n=1 Tax=Mucilaginibacter TaxID=423349 RepID=UPI00339A2CAF